MARRRTQYQGGQIAQASVDADFVQLRESANMFSSLNKKLNSMTQFAIARGAEQAESRAIRNVLTDPAVTDVNLEKLQTMSDEDRGKFFGDGGNAYVKKTREIGTSILISNLKTELQKQLTLDFQDDLENMVAPEKHYADMVQRRDGYLEAITNDPVLQFQFNQEIGDFLYNKDISYREKYLTKQKKQALFQHENETLVGPVLQNFDASDPAKSYEEALNNNQTIVLTNDGNQEYVNRTEKRILEQLKGSVQDTIENLTLTSSQLEDLAQSVKQNNLAGIQQVLEQVIVDDPSNDSAYADKATTYTNVAKTMAGILEMSESNADIDAYEFLIEPLLEPEVDQNFLDNVVNLQEREIEGAMGDDPTNEDRLDLIKAYPDQEEFINNKYKSKNRVVVEFDFQPKDLEQDQTKDTIIAAIEREQIPGDIANQVEQLLFDKKGVVTAGELAEIMPTSQFNDIPSETEIIVSFASYQDIKNKDFATDSILVKEFNQGIMSYVSTDLGNFLTKQKYNPNLGTTEIASQFDLIDSAIEKQAYLQFQNYMLLNYDDFRENAKEGEGTMKNFIKKNIGVFYNELLRVDDYATKRTFFEQNTTEYTRKNFNNTNYDSAKVIRLTSRDGDVIDINFEGMNIPRNFFDGLNTDDRQKQRDEAERLRRELLRYQDNAFAIKDATMSGYTADGQMSASIQQSAENMLEVYATLIIQLDAM